MLACAGRAWLGGLRAAGAGRACVLGRARRARQAGVGRRAWRAGRAEARRASVLGRAGLACWGAQGQQAHGRARASGSWVQAQAGCRALGA